MKNKEEHPTEETKPIFYDLDVKSYLGHSTNVLLLQTSARLQMILLSSVKKHYISKLLAEAVLHIFTHLRKFYCKKFDSNLL